MVHHRDVFFYHTCYRGTLFYDFRRQTSLIRSFTAIDDSPIREDYIIQTPYYATEVVYRVTLTEIDLY